MYVAYPITIPMKFKKIIISLACIFALLFHACGQPTGAAAADRILLFHKTAGFYHKSIPAGVEALKELGRENNITVDASDDSTLFTVENLKKYRAIVFLSTTGDILNSSQQDALQQYIRGGGGFVGIHAAADTEYDWPWYNQLVGAYFKSHPKPQSATVVVVDKSHPSTQHLPDKWTRSDEWYNYKSIVPGLKVLCKLDETSYQGGQNGDEHPIAWYRDFDGGRSFYTGGGHTDETFREPEFLQHLLGGIQYAMGKVQ